MFVLFMSCFSLTEVQLCPNPAPADLNKLNLRPRSVGENTAAQEFVLVIKSCNSWRDFFELLC